MNEQKLITEITSIIQNYTDDDGNIKSWKAGRIAERIVKNCNLQSVSNNEVVVCPRCKSTHTIYSDFLKEYQCAKCNHHWAN